MTDEQALKSLRFYCREVWDDMIQGFAVAILPHRFWNVGDVLVTSLTTGAGRYAVSGISSKGRRLVHYWTGMESWPRMNAHRYIRYVEVPGELADLPPTDPALGRFAVSLAREARPLQ